MYSIEHFKEPIGIAKLGVSNTLGLFFSIFRVRGSSSNLGPSCKIPSTSILAELQFSTTVTPRS